MDEQNQKNEVTKTTTNAPATMSKAAQDAHKNFQGSPVNLVVPQLLVKNPKSPHLDPYGLNDGDIVDTLDYRCLAPLGEKKQIIPFSSSSIWLLYTVGKNNVEFDSTQEFTGERLPYEEQLSNGQVIRRKLGIQVLFLFVEDIKEGVAMPYASTFKGSATIAGKKINTIMYVKNRMANIAPWGSIVDLYSVKRDHPQGAYFTFDAQQNVNRKANEEEQQQAEYWYQQMVASNFEVDNETGETFDPETGEVK